MKLTKGLLLLLLGAAACGPAYAEGRKAGYAVQSIVNLLEQYKQENGRYPASLSEVPAKEHIAVVGESTLRYRRDEARGFELRFASLDGQLDTADDDVEFGTP